MLTLFLIGCNAAAPPVDVTGPGSGVYLLAPLMSFEDVATIVILDAADGTELWRNDVDASLQWLDARLSPDGSSIFVLANDPIKHDGQVSSIVEIDADGQTVSQTQVTDGHHAFDLIEQEDGSVQFAWIRAVVRHDLDAEIPVVSDQVVVQDADGNQTVVLDVLDVLDFDPRLIRFDPIPFYPGMIDWTHANALRWNAERERFVLSLALQAAVWEFDATGTVTAVFTSTPDARIFYETGHAYQKNPFPIYQTDFSRQHGTELGSEGELRLLANGDDALEPSFASIYRRETGATHGEFQAFSPFEGTHVAVLGGAAALPDGGTIVSWGSLGGLQSLDADGESRWVLPAEDGQVFPNISVYADAGARFLTP